MSTTTNTDRAAWALEALDAYAKSQGNEHDGMFTRISDLVIDLRHLADRHGIDWDKVIDRIALHYEIETFK